MQHVIAKPAFVLMFCLEC